MGRATHTLLFLSSAATPEAEAWRVCTLLNLCLPALEEVESVRGFGVYVLHYREDVENILFCEGGLVPVVEVVLFQQDLEEPKRLEVTVTAFTGTRQEERGKRALNSACGVTAKTSCITIFCINSFEGSRVGVHHHVCVVKSHHDAQVRRCLY